MTDVVIAGAARTPVGAFNGGVAKVAASYLGTVAIAEAMQRPTADAAGVEPGQDVSFSANRLVLAQRGLILECLANLDQLPSTGATLVIGPLRLEGGSGAPASVLALVP